METHIEQTIRHDHLGVVISSLLMDGVATVGFLAMAAMAFFSWLRRRRFVKHVKTALNPDTPLVPGKAYITGIVEWEKDAKLAVQALMEDEGTEHENSGSWTYRWIETSRRIHVQPFYIRHASGQRIRVEPGEKVRFRDAVDRIMRVDLATRVRVAELMPGETVFAVGELRRAPDPEALTEGYRGQALGYLLEPLPDRDMFLSTEPLDTKVEEVAHRMRWRTMFILIVFLLFHALFASFHARRWLGTTTYAQVTWLREKRDADDNKHYWVEVQVAKGFIFGDEIDESDFMQLHRRQLVQVRYVPQWKSVSVIGPGATVHWCAVWAVPLGFVLFLLALGVGSYRLEWYDLKKTPTQLGDGPLAASRPFVPEDESAPAEASAAVQERPEPENAGSTSEPPSPHRHERHKSDRIVDGPDGMI